MSYQDVIEGLHERFATIEGLKVLDYEPTTLEPPVIYSMLDTFERSLSGGVVAMTYRILHRLCLQWQDFEQAELALMAYVNAIPAAVDADRHLGGRLTQGEAKITDGQAGFTTTGQGQTVYRVLTFYSTVVEKGPRGGPL